MASTGYIEGVLDTAMHTRLAGVHLGSNSDPKRSDVRFSLSTDADTWANCLVRVEFIPPRCVTLHVPTYYDPTDRLGTTDSGFTSKTDFIWVVDVGFSYRGNPLDTNCFPPSKDHEMVGWFKVSVRPANSDALRALDANGSHYRRYPIVFRVSR